MTKKQVKRMQGGEGLKQKVTNRRYVYTGENKVEDGRLMLQVWRLEDGPKDPEYVNAKCLLPNPNDE